MNMVKRNYMAMSMYSWATYASSSLQIQSGTGQDVTRLVLARRDTRGRAGGEKSECVCVGLKTSLQLHSGSNRYKTVSCELELS